MNPLFELVTITPQFDFNQLEDRKYYTIYDDAGCAESWQGDHLKKKSEFNDIDFEFMKHVLLPYSDQKVVIEEDTYPYCSKCSNCGEDGCCPASGCEFTKNGLYCQTYLKDLKFAYLMYHNTYEFLKDDEESKTKIDQIFHSNWEQIYSTDVSVSPSVEVSKKPLSDELTLKIKKKAQEFIYTQYIDYGDQTPMAENQILEAFISGYSSAVPPLVIVSDEEIEREADKYANACNKIGALTNREFECKKQGFIYSAKWMRDKLKGGNTK